MTAARRIVFPGACLAVLCQTLFGLSYVFTKRATAEATPLALVGWRFFVAVLAMEACRAAGFVKVRLKGKPLGPLFGLALGSPVLFFVGQTLGIARSTASESGVILALMPVACLVASSLFLRRVPSRRQTAGVLLSLAGVVTSVLAVGRSALFSPFAYACLFSAVGGYALYSVFVARARAFSGAEITYAMLVAGAAAFGPAAVAEAIWQGRFVALARLPLVSPAFGLAVAYQGLVCSVIAFFLANVALARLGVNRMASFTGVSTLASVAGGVLVLGEPFSGAQAAGAALVLGGILLANGRAR